MIDFIAQLYDSIERMKNSDLPEDIKNVIVAQRLQLIEEIKKCP